MAIRILSIEIGNTLTKVCETDYHQLANPKVYHSFSFLTPRGVINDGFVKPDVDFAKKLKEEIEQNGLKSRHAVFTVNSSKIITREATIPYVKEKRIPEILAANASEYFPIDISGYQLDYLKMSSEADSRQNRKYKLMLVAMPQNLIDSYLQLAETCNLNMEAIDYMGNSVFQAVKKECGDEGTLVAKIEGHSTFCMVMHRDYMVMSRNVPYGTSDAIHKRMEQDPGMTYQEALDHFLDENLLEENGEPTMYTPSFNMFLNNLSRVIGFYNAQNPNDKIKRIILTGTGSEFKGLPKLVADSQEAEVVTLEKLTGVNISKGIDAERLGIFLPSVGACINPLRFYHTEKEAKKSASTQVGLSWRFTWIVFGFCVLIGVVAFLMALLDYQSARSENLSYRKEISDRHDIIPIYEEYVQSKYARDYLKSAKEQTDFPTEQLIPFIEEMQKKMPRDFVVTSFMADTTQVTIDITVPTKKEANYAIMQFRTFDSLSDVKVANINDSAADTPDTGTVTFTVQGTYVPTEKTVQVTATADGQATDQTAGTASAASEETTAATGTAQ